MPYSFSKTDDDYMRDLMDILERFDIASRDILRAVDVHGFVEAVKRCMMIDRRCVVLFLRKHGRSGRIAPDRIAVAQTMLQEPILPELTKQVKSINLRAVPHDVKVESIPTKRPIKLNRRNLNG